MFCREQVSRSKKARCSRRRAFRFRSQDKRRSALKFLLHFRHNKPYYLMPYEFGCSIALDDLGQRGPVQNVDE